MEKKNVMQQEMITLPIMDKVTTSIDEERHPNFIESNTQAITLKDLTEKNIIPTFSDNSLTISHQNFIGAVTKVANNVFGELTPVECRVKDNLLPAHGLCLPRIEPCKGNQRTNGKPLHRGSKGV